MQKFDSDFSKLEWIDGGEAHARIDGLRNRKNSFAVLLVRATQ